MLFAFNLDEAHSYLTLGRVRSEKEEIKFEGQILDFELSSELFNETELKTVKQKLLNGSIGLKSRAAKILLGTGISETTLKRK